MYEYLELLIYIGKKGGLFADIQNSTLQIAKELNISQQTISRKLREMEDKGLLKRLATPNGMTLSLNKPGRELLQKNYQELSSIFKTKKTAINGIVEKGIGEGAYYVSQKEYQDQFKEKMGFTAFPGTLNLRIDKEELLSFISSTLPVKIQGFQTKQRTFGPLTCYKIKVKDIPSAIVIPERTRHNEEVIEIISSVNLRERLQLSDKDKVKLS
ncbi:MAG: DUF120 domain-containing protein [Nanoarchaeota archaeon]